MLRVVYELYMRIRPGTELKKNYGKGPAKKKNLSVL